MSASEPNLQSLLQFDNDDILNAMNRLTKIMQSEKQLQPVQSDKQLQTTQPQQPLQHMTSPGPHPVAFTNPFTSPEEPYYDEADLVENLRSVAHELSTMDIQHPVETFHEEQEEEQEEEEEEEPQYEECEADQSKYLSTEKDVKTNRSMSIVDRLYQLDTKKREKIAAKQFEKYKQEMSNLRQKPTISHTSKVIAEQKQKAPIFERCNAIMKQREENINKMRRELQSTRGDSNSSPTFQPDLSFTKRHNHNHERSRTPKQFADDVYAWQYRKEENLQKGQYENIAKELSELTFKPKINDRSKVLAKRVSTKEPVDRRLYNHKDVLEERRQEAIEKDTPSFTPILNEKSQNLMRNRKNHVTKSPRLDKSVNLSTVEKSRVGTSAKKETSILGRSLTPVKSSKGKVSRDHSPQLQKSPQVMRSSQVLKSPQVTKCAKMNKSPKGPKSPRFNEVNYTPAVDFLVKRFK